jgi:aminoglycoside phosphotransferase (APT) family kinase protein
VTEPGTAPIAAGRDADVFALDEHRVLRRYRREADVSGEAALMRYVAGYGYPVPEVFEAAGRDLVMTRVDGPTMAEAMMTGAMGVDEGARMQAALLAQLHAIPAPGGATVIHLDLHPENVLVTAAGPAVIDWANARTGSADFDTAISALIMAQLAVGSIRHELIPLAAEFLDRFLEYAPGDVLRGLDAALDMRLHNRTMTPDELAALPAAAERVRTGMRR